METPLEVRMGDRTHGATLGECEQWAEEVRLFKEYIAQLEGEPCSICGSQPALLIDAKEKATYWMCAECMLEKVLIKMELEAKLEAMLCGECEKSMLECECNEESDV